MTIRHLNIWQLFLYLLHELLKCRLNELNLFFQIDILLVVGWFFPPITQISPPHLLHC